MQITLERGVSTEDSTLGKLYLDGEFQCYTLEDVEREEKIAGKTAIPAGTYKVNKRFSPRFGIVTPHLLDVPEFTYILIHWGNTAKDTDGCILVGEKQEDNAIVASRAAFKALMGKLATATDISITITSKTGILNPVKEEKAK